MALLLLAVASLVQFVLPFVERYRSGDKLPQESLVYLYRALSAVQLTGALVAFVCLEILLLTDDFSVAYVQANSHTDLPLVYKIAALWGAHEGSLLLWVLLLAAWALWLPMDDAASPMPARSVMAGIICLFTFFTVLTSNPFVPLLPLAPLVGSDLNPLLQHPALAIHPPILYAGYTATALLFALAVQALASGQWGSTLTPQMSVRSRVSLGLLTAGISLGSWWAYQELGWGGFWFWDPVESLSLLPWFLVAALVHTLASGRVPRAIAPAISWSLVLAILCFPMAVLGAFMVRSGLLISVHSFASDPSRGLFLLALLAVIAVPALLLLLRAARLKTRTGPPRHEAQVLYSRGALLLWAALAFTVFEAVVLLGLLYPLGYEVFTGRKATLGAPYFETVLFPLAVATALGLTVALDSKWFASVSARTGVQGASHWIAKGKWVWIWLVLWGVMVLIYSRGYDQTQGGGVFSQDGVVLAWIALLLTFLLMAFRSLLRYLIFQWQGSMRQVAAQSSAGISTRVPFRWRMWIAHTAVILCALGASLQGVMGQRQEVLIAVGEQLETQVGRLVFNDLNETFAPNYRGQLAHFSLYTFAGTQVDLYPEKRLYLARGQVLTEVAVAQVAWGDFYLALGAAETDGRWPLRIHYKPFMWLLWLGLGLLAIGLILPNSWGKWLGNQIGVTVRLGVAFVRASILQMVRAWSRVK
ncbi:MAG: cytochrome c-type biogenesis CcmF C-terminal domain-containing protein [Gammaproteobacteria bacterium]